MIPEELCKLASAGKAVRRQRVLTGDELKSVWGVLIERLGDPYADCMRFMLLTLLRRSEAENVKWADVDLGGSVVRISETKNGREHMVSLSRQAVEVLRGRQSLMVGRSGDEELVFPSERGGLLGGWDRAQKIAYKASGTGGWHRHDLRRTGATLLGEMGVEPYIIEAALNHVSIHSALAATYNIARYRPRVADALQMLGDALGQIPARTSPISIAAGGAGQPRRLAALPLPFSDDDEGAA